MTRGCCRESKAEGCGRRGKMWQDEDEDEDEVEVEVRKTSDRTKRVTR